MSGYHFASTLWFLIAATHCNISFRLGRAASGGAGPQSRRAPLAISQSQYGISENSLFPPKNSDMAPDMAFFEHTLHWLIG